jgi:hypothetical protein
MRYLKEEMMQLVFSDGVVLKLKEKHGVNTSEVCECFMNRAGRFLEDTRERHRTDPPSQWFISETDRGRRLKIVFIEKRDKGVIEIKTAYEPDEIEEHIYGKYS